MNLGNNFWTKLGLRRMAEVQRDVSKPPGLSNFPLRQGTSHRPKSLADIEANSGNHAAQDILARRLIVFWKTIK